MKPSFPRALEIEAYVFSTLAQTDGCERFFAERSANEWSAGWPRSLANVPQRARIRGRLGGTCAP
jgi:hypothetical protein